VHAVKAFGKVDCSTAMHGHQWSRSFAGPLFPREKAPCAGWAPEPIGHFGEQKYVLFLPRSNPIPPPSDPYPMHRATAGLHSPLKVFCDKTEVHVRISVRKRGKSFYELEMFAVHCKKVGLFSVVKSQNRRDVNGACVSACSECKPSGRHACWMSKVCMCG
jgi:hypothetical protein